MVPLLLAARVDLEHVLIVGAVLFAIGLYVALTKRNADGLRLMKSGRPLIITVDTAGESTEQVDVLELIHDSWLKAGIKLFTKPSQREVFRQRIVAGQSIMSVWSGISNGIPRASMSPEELARVTSDNTFRLFAKAKRPATAAAGA